MLIQDHATAEIQQLHVCCLASPCCALLDPFTRRCMQQHANKTHLVEVAEMGTGLVYRCITHFKHASHHHSSCICRSCLITDPCPKDSHPVQSVPSLGRLNPQHPTISVKGLRVSDVHQKTAWSHSLLSRPFSFKTQYDSPLTLPCSSYEWSIVGTIMQAQSSMKSTSMLGVQTAFSHRSDSCLAVLCSG